MFWNSRFEALVPLTNDVMLKALYWHTKKKRMLHQIKQRFVCGQELCKTYQDDYLSKEFFFLHTESKAKSVCFVLWIQSYASKNGSLFLDFIKIKIKPAFHMNKKVGIICKRSCRKFVLVLRIASPSRN
ncbi:CLUMA_CG014859, isoform A [Clunio marinus]|uniref:CLUMA_CG014859, isoform A n=1 Tax=Clunio marinus TaxID=568069 RepID=A0A1J1IQ27_9DIPT|nr:CLUMA_CG014859, isoform A [Clunio marinus]